MLSQSLTVNGGRKKEKRKKEGKEKKKKYIYIYVYIYGKMCNKLNELFGTKVHTCEDVSLLQRPMGNFQTCFLFFFFYYYWGRGREIFFVINFSSPFPLLELNGLFISAYLVISHILKY